MKRIMNAVILLLGLSMVIMVSCTKPDDPNNGENGGNNNDENVNIIGGHAYIDLGLPSGLLWATCNIGATTTESMGSGFAWAGLEPFDTVGGLHPSNAYWNESLQQYTKYNYEDGLRYLEQEDDIAVQSWGNGWRTPTPEEWEELYRNCSYEHKFQNGQWGLLLTRGEKSLFLPGIYEIYEEHPLGGGSYWANEREWSSEYRAYYYGFIYYYLGHQRFEQKVDCHNRYMSFSVRPVHSAN